MDSDKSLRKHLHYLLRGGGAHIGFREAIAAFPTKARGVKPKGAAHSAWQLLEHLRIAQWDILEFSRNPKHISPDWPGGYWPIAAAPPSASAWRRSACAFEADLKAMEKLVASSRTDLHARIPHGDGQTILREVLLVADHNSYHLGQLVLLARLLGVWRD